MALLAKKSTGFMVTWSQPIRTVYGMCRVGHRDLVGHGINGCANYKDDAHFPFPAVRFKENSRDICALREKEKGDWKMLCCEEKKALYRASFCQTFAEFQHETGTWKFVLGSIFIVTSFTLWMAMFYHYYVAEPLPKSLSKQSQKAQLRRMLEIRANPIEGISSKWDYDNDRWKPIRKIHGTRRVGHRDLVGHGINGCANYKDDAHFPFPAVRFKENSRDICALREKEKGDWKMLCCEEKKALYRASFCQTFAEFQHETGTWKYILGAVFFITSLTFWMAMFYHNYVAEPLPVSLSEQSQKAQLRRMLDMRVNPIDGISSKWDYDNDRWKFESSCAR